MTTSSEQVLPSPTKIRARKSRHRRINSRGQMKEVMSPIKDGSHDEQHPYPSGIGAKLHHVDPHDVTPKSFKYMGPGTAIREYRSEDEHRDESSEHRDESSDTSSRRQQQNKIAVDDRNLNDVCFGCDGGCSDATCSSKRSSQVSADVESNTCDSVCNSPRHQTHQVYGCVENVKPVDLYLQSKKFREKDSNENLSCPLEISAGIDKMTADINEILILEDTRRADNTFEPRADNAVEAKADNCVEKNPVINSNVNVSVKRGISETEISPKHSPVLDHVETSNSLETVPMRKKPAVKFRNVKVRKNISVSFVSSLFRYYFFLPFHPFSNSFCHYYVFFFLFILFHTLFFLFSSFFHALFHFCSFIFSTFFYLFIHFFHFLLLSKVGFYFYFWLFVILAILSFLILSDAFFFSLLVQPVLHDCYNKCCMYYPVCRMVHIKEPLLLTGKSNLCSGSSRFPLLMNCLLLYV